jgi:multicomponent Na+:H+ antiporter subunit E
MEKRGLLRRAAAAAALAAIFFRELMLSSWAVTRAAFARQPRTHSAILAVPIELRTDLGIALLANLVSLTPGTTSLHVSDDRRTLYIHTLDAMAPDDVVASVKDVFERRIAEIEG